MQAEVDGERLTIAEIASFFILLRRRQRDHPQRDQPRSPRSSRITRTSETVVADFDAMAKTAVEEIVRWASPVIYMRRRVMEDTEIGGQPMQAGDKVAMWYASANRDEAHFPDPYRFDLAAIPTRRSATEPAGRTSASAPTWPGGRSRWRSVSCSTRSRHPRCRRAGDAALAVHPRHQAAGVRVHAALTTAHTRTISRPTAPYGAAVFGRRKINTKEVVSVLGGAGLLAGSWVLVARHEVVPLGRPACSRPSTIGPTRSGR